MTLEDVAKAYGMNDYYDIYTGYIYQLSKAIDLGNGTLSIPVIDAVTGKLFGHAIMGAV